MTETPIYDTLKRERAEAAVNAAPRDPEGIRLVRAIHESKRSQLVPRAKVLPLLGGLFK
jgi:hypothetical protein